MTMPYLMNCEHQGEGWCLACVKGLQIRIDNVQSELDKAGVVNGDEVGEYSLGYRVAILEKERAHYAAECSRQFQLAVKKTLNESARIKELELSVSLMEDALRKQNAEDHPLHVRIGELTAKVRELEIFAHADRVKFNIACEQRDEYHTKHHYAEEKIKQLIAETHEHKTSAPNLPQPQTSEGSLP